jgi:hypothetical protein
MVFNATFNNVIGLGVRVMEFSATFNNMIGIGVRVMVNMTSAVKTQIT